MQPASTRPAAQQASAQIASCPLPATRSASLDGSVRTLVLTVADPIQYMEGRRMPRHQAEPRWIDAYQVCSNRQKRCFAFDYLGT